LAVRASSHPLMILQVAEKYDGALTMSILDIVSGKHIESMAACSLTIARALRDN
jgi:hypothetical protein